MWEDECRDPETGGRRPLSTLYSRSAAGTIRRIFERDRRRYGTDQRENYTCFICDVSKSRIEGSDRIVCISCQVEAGMEVD